MIERLQVIFHGRVQGVGFRQTCVCLSQDFKITGYVKNCADGSVELVAEAKKADLEKFLKKILNSYLSKGIVNYHPTWLIADKTFDSFRVSY